MPRQQTTVDYAVDMPKELRDAVRPHLDRWLWVVPPWCRIIHVCHRHACDDTPGIVASNETSVEYRWARVAVYPAWLDQDDDERSRSALHELLHVILAPMHDVLSGVLEQTENEPFASTVEEDFRRAMEGAVQDLTFALVEAA